MSEALTFIGYASAATSRAMSAVRVSAYVAKFWANRSNEETITAGRAIQPMGLVGWRMATNRPTTAINANVSTANKRIPGHGETAEGTEATNS